MSEKIIRIKNCRECPRYTGDYPDPSVYQKCSLTWESVEDFTSDIPPSCPLEDAPAVQE